MGVREWLIKKLESDVERTAGHIDLESLTEEERNNNFTQFGEGDPNLTKFLKTAYEHGAPSIFCCSGHGNKSAYVMLKVTDENIELLRKMGRVLSKEGVTTNFIDHYIRGKTVTLRSLETVSTSWLNKASQIMETPELFDDSNPGAYYHEEMHSSYKPFGFDFKKRLLNYLRRTSAQLPASSQTENEPKPKQSWELSEEEKSQINKIDLAKTQQSQTRENNESSKEEVK